MPWELIVGIVALVIGLTALVVALVVLRRSRAQHAAPAADSSTRAVAGPQVAVIVNPSKEHTRQVAETVRRLAAEAALPEPRFYDTTVEDPGTGQARQALDDGADVVVAAGGDGTVRAVADGLVGSGRPMGIIPAGTGNLLARNLDLPLADVEEAFAVVLGGVDRTIDVGRLKIVRTADDDGDGAEEGSAHLFLVIAGLGFDAAMVADADDALKARVGWVAYFLAGVRHLHGRRLRATIGVDDRPVVEARLRTVMVGNCGRLPGGITLLPDAVIDDGELDVAAIDTRGGLAGWAQLLGEVVAQGMGMQNDLKVKIGRIDHVRAKRATIVVEGGEQAQVDGEVLGKALELETWVEPGALVVRTPA
ncbi:diacylglycerol kinase family enzyme [Isoptericola jiangsuensis]|uniref:Diacylglycerol kinase family enzyme n=1 Tax=Isoptericola jiangsuensis TaxID=548579 RepID=A0A2A9F2K0_9MICO|nr:diacylglycerol kinase family protein [Isoptericola jiangsuensis]PFG44649.1 diacylglycerol kinase family enzyme [Isoptericola jiangsuensis]